MQICGLPSLVELDLSNNQLVEVPASIACLNNLVTLLLHNNKLSNLPEEIGSMSALKILTWHDNPIEKSEYFSLSLSLSLTYSLTTHHSVLAMVYFGITNTRDALRYLRTKTAVAPVVTQTSSWQLKKAEEESKG